MIPSLTFAPSESFQRTSTKPLHLAKVSMNVPFDLEDLVLQCYRSKIFLMESQNVIFSSECFWLLMGGQTITSHVLAYLQQGCRWDRHRWILYLIWWQTVMPILLMFHASRIEDVKWRKYVFSWPCMCKACNVSDGWKLEYPKHIDHVKPIRCDKTKQR